MTRVLGRAILIAMPFSALNYPSIGLGLLKPALRDIGVTCEVRHFFLEFADLIGEEAYGLATAPELYQAMVGDWIFSHMAHHPDHANSSDEGDLGFFLDVLRPHFPAFFTPDRLHALLQARSAAGAFIEQCLDCIDWHAFDIVGFTSSFQQNTASLALARRIKERHPRTLMVFGGANCRDEMGRALIERYPFIDAVCLGEGDRCFPAFVANYLTGGRWEQVSGMAVRRECAVVGSSRAADTVTDLDALPIPDFSDFFAQHAASIVAKSRYAPVALFETSRGCWWGQKHHCTFCGINGNGMAYRSKSADRALSEITELVRRHGPDLLNTDAILDMRYFETLLPRLAELPTPITAYFELKANLRSGQFALLRMAGILKIQPGIESLDSGILASMRKGCTAIQNVQTLKLAAEHRLYVEWNMLSGFPGETTEQYQRMKQLIPRLIHLQAPAVVGRVRADRFSPYFREPERYRISISPNAGYRYVYPFPEVAELAYHFDMQADEPRSDPSAVEEVAALCRAWKAGQSQSSLVSVELDEVVVVLDRRQGCPPCGHRLRGPEAAILKASWSIVSLGKLRRDLADAYTEQALRDAVAHLEQLGLVMVEGGDVLALPLTQNEHGRALSWPEIRARPA